MAEDSRVPPAERYQLVHRTMRGIARREPTFALHVHIGVADPESAIRLLNRLRAHLPLLLALSASSPLWRGRATGLASNRTILFQAFPRTGLPRYFDGYADWVRTVDLLLRSGAIPEPTFLWWDVRPQPRFGTVEVRIMDAQPAARGRRAHCARSCRRWRDWSSRRATRRAELVHAQEALAENRFLAARDGVAAELIDPVRALRVPVADLLADLLRAAMPHAAALGAADELARPGARRRPRGRPAGGAGRPRGRPRGGVRPGSALQPRRWPADRIIRAPTARRAIHATALEPGSARRAALSARPHLTGRTAPAAVGQQPIDGDDVQRQDRQREERARARGRAAS